MADVAGAGARGAVVGMRPEQALGGLVGTVASTLRLCRFLQMGPNVFYLQCESCIVWLLCAEQTGGSAWRQGATGGSASPGEAVGLGPWGGLEGKENGSHLELILTADVRGFPARSQGTFCLLWGWLSIFPPAGTPGSEDTESRALLSGTGAAAEDP